VVNDRDIREVLIQELASAAAWRRDAATDHPEQPAHLGSASALDRLIGYIRDLPEDDPRLRALADLNRDPEFFLLGGEDTRDLLDQYGYDTVNTRDLAQAGDRFLDRLLAAARADEADDDSPPA
jgi:hypothetical protein